MADVGGGGFNGAALLGGGSGGSVGGGGEGRERDSGEREREMERRGDGETGRRVPPALDADRLPPLSLGFGVCQPSGRDCRGVKCSCSCRPWTSVCSRERMMMVMAVAAGCVRVEWADDKQ